MNRDQMVRWGEEPLVKSQSVRLLDVFLIGPIMVAGGMRLQKEWPGWAEALVFFGVSTIVYNARNYSTVQVHLAAQAHKDASAS